MPKQKIIKIGNSLGITLPAHFVQNLSLRVGDGVEVTQDDDNALIIHFPNNSQLSLLNVRVQKTTNVL